MSLIPALLLGFIPSFIWLYFFIREDEAHPEPKSLIIYTFIAGALVTFFVLGPQMFLSNFFADFGTTQYGFVPLFVLSLVEEVFKFLAVYFLVSRTRDFDEPLDAMIYMIVVALGFAAVENVASILNGENGSTISAMGISLLSLRFIGATLLHSVSSAFVGYYWGLAMLQKSGFKLMIIEGIGVATLLHAIFNHLIIVYGPESLVATALLVAAAFFLLNDFEILKKYDTEPPTKTL